MENINKILVIGIGILLIILLFNIIFINASLKPSFSRFALEIENALKKPIAELKIINVNCELCYSVDNVINELNKTFNITSIKEYNFNSQEAKELIDKYGIEKLPTVIIESEKEINLSGFENKKIEGKNILVFTDIKPPYVNNEGKTIGLVEAISIITKNCEVCRDLGPIISSLKENGIVFERIRAVEYGSEEANELISKYNLTKVPALLLSEDIDAYVIGQQLSQQLKKENGYYVIESPAPYINTSNGKLRGSIELTMLYDSTCDICYNVTLHKNILERMGMYIEKENIIDINSNEGKEIIEKYNITQIPTILLRGDINAYEGFNQVWQQVGSIEEDNTYVFRNLSALGKVTYKDLSRGGVINA